MFPVAAGAALVLSLGLSALSGKYSLGIGYSFHAALIALLAWGAMRRAHAPLGRGLNHRFLCAIGIGSYSLYLWQQVFLNPHGTAFANEFPQNIVFALVAAYLSYKWVEKPFLGLKEALAKGGKSPQGASQTRQPLGAELEGVAG
jgi:peptidoglycan/LPS O-acetylase OafA/YrhL